VVGLEPHMYWNRLFLPLIVIASLLVPLARSKQVVRDECVSVRVDPNSDIEEDVGVHIAR